MGVLFNFRTSRFTNVVSGYSVSRLLDLSSTTIMQSNRARLSLLWFWGRFDKKWRLGNRTMAERIEQYSSLIEDENGVSYKVESMTLTQRHQGCGKVGWNFIHWKATCPCCGLNERLRNQTERP